MPEMWELPGGRLEVGEDPYEGLKREIKEEIGIDIDIVHSLNVKHFTRQDGQIITMIIFLCKPLSKDINISGEHEEFKWIDLTKEDKELIEFLGYDSFFLKDVEVFRKLGFDKFV